MYHKLLKNIIAWELIFLINLAVFSEYSWYCSEVKNFNFFNICMSYDIILSFVMVSVFILLTNYSKEGIFSFLFIFLCTTIILKWMNTSINIKEIHEFFIADLGKFLGLLFGIIILKDIKVVFRLLPYSLLLIIFIYLFPFIKNIGNLIFLE